MTDIEDLLAAAADDTHRPPQHSVEEIVAQGRRSVRRRRIGIVTTSVLTTVAVVGGITAWSTTLNQSDGLAGTPENQTITVDAKTGRVVDNESGTTAQAPPPVSPLSDAEVLKRCKQYDNEYVESNRERGSNTFDKAGTINARWTVLVKSGDRSRLQALFLAPDKSIVSSCTMEGPERPKTNGRYSTTEGFKVPNGQDDQRPQAVQAHVRVPVTGAAQVLVNLIGEPTPRLALVGPEGFFTLGYPTWRDFYPPSPNASPEDWQPAVQRVRAYDAAGKRVYDWKYKKPVRPTPTPIPADVKIKVQPPIILDVELTKDPETGKPLAATPPVSPVSDDQIRTRCKKPDDSYFKDTNGKADDQRTIDAGKITPDWKVVLKTGTGIDFTALLVSPGDNVLAWCHMYDKVDSYDYGRSGVPATGKFGIGMEWGQVPDGVAQIIVDLPKTGSVKALISNGYFIWGLTGGNSDIKKVRVRGYDAQGKKVYDAKHDVDADASGR
ncbi:hypothetical protein [Streptomyces sp. SID13031]|uniref:hypothetical protein n=1 Tax=Streptomyces sp. SID13031 TaxID=2706046 RepID=UPI0013C6D63D|nr:hypothetical protein [Streptomyces sp. SID13031]NEA30841.1 hypothetical protein [Streptomyces sp. SID13031]